MGGHIHPVMYNSEYMKFQTIASNSS